MWLNTSKGTSCLWRSKLTFCLFLKSCSFSSIFLKIKYWRFQNMWNLKIDFGTIFWDILTLHLYNSKSSLPTTGTFRYVETHMCKWCTQANLNDLFIYLMYHLSFFFLFMFDFWNGNYLLLGWSVQVSLKCLVIFITFFFSERSILWSYHAIMT